MTMCSEKVFLSATCGVNIDDEYILWAESLEGDLYKYDLISEKNEFVNSPKAAGHYGKAFSCMLRHQGKIYMIALTDAYEIMEYNINTHQIQLKYQNIKKKVEIFNSFFIEDKIYLFPSFLDEDVCIYSLKEDSAEYIRWDNILPSSNCFLRENVVNVSQHANKFYGAIWNTPYIFRLEMTPKIICEMTNLGESYHTEGIIASERELYITLMERKGVLCIRQDGKIEEIDCLESVQDSESNKIPYIMTIIYEQQIILFPGEGNNQIRIINRQTNKQTVLSYPDCFRRRQSGRLFWKPILYKSKLILLPFCGNGMLILDLNNYQITYKKWKNKDLESFIKKISTNALFDSKRNKGQNLGECIYHLLGS